MAKKKDHWFDSNFIPRNSKKFEYSYFDWAIRFLIKNESENRKHKVPWLSKFPEIFNSKFWNFNALLRKYSLLNLKSDWLMWKRTSRSISLGIMKVYSYGFDRGFHNSTKSVKSTFIKNQKPYVVLEEFLYNKHIFFQILLKNNDRYCAYYIRILSKQCMVSDFW